MKRWSIFGAAKAPEPIQEPPATAPGGFEWSAMFNIRKKIVGRRARPEGAEAEQPTSV